MRTAITLFKGHDGKWSVVGTPDVPLQEQKTKFRALRASRANKEIALAIYQESDGHAEQIRLMKPDELKKLEDENAKAEVEAEKFAKAEAEREVKDPELLKQIEQFNKTAAEAAQAEAANKTK